MRPVHCFIQMDRGMKIPLLGRSAKKGRGVKKPTTLNEVLGLMRLAVDTYERTANRSLKHLNVTVSMIGALAAIARQPNGCVSMKELERLRHISQPVTLGIVGRLEERRLVKTHFVEDDSGNRVKMAAITDAGRYLMHEAQFPVHDSLVDAFEGVDAAEVDELKRVLKKMWGRTLGEG